MPRKKKPKQPLSPAEELAEQEKSSYLDLIDSLLVLPDGEMVVLCCPECSKLVEEKSPHHLPFCNCRNLEDPAQSLVMMYQITDEAMLAIYRLGGLKALAYWRESE